MKYFDVHCHVFPDGVAPKVVASLESYYHEPWRRKGTVADLHESLEEAHIDKAVFLASATRPDQVRNLNNYLASLLGPKVICLGSLQKLHSRRRAHPHPLVKQVLRSLR